MWIKNMKLSNFRNLSEIECNFNQKVNYFVGENNLGKSNVLDALGIIFNKFKFSEEDFLDNEVAITVAITIIFEEEEMGIFDDEVSDDKGNELTLTISQIYEDDSFEIINEYTKSKINVKDFHKINYLSYSSKRMPKAELRFDKSNGLGAFLNFLIHKYMKDNSKESKDILIEEELVKIVDNTNSVMSKLQTFSEYSIMAKAVPKSDDLITKIIGLYDENQISLDKTGDGIQYSSMISLSILNKVLELNNRYHGDMNEVLYTAQNENKYLQLFVALDEPEIHLHPFLQRTVIKNVKDIVQNTDKNFNEILEKCFDFNYISGQLFVVTHSPQILDGNYENIVRFYKKEDMTKISCGMNVKLKDDTEKQLLMRFEDIKQAFYSKVVILVEGVSELGCIKYFADKLDINLDKCGIAVISADGEKNILPISRLLVQYCIPTINIYDNDTGKIVDDNSFITKGICFEYDIAEKLIDTHQLEVLKDIIRCSKSKALDMLLDSDYLKGSFAKIGIKKEDIVEKKLSELDETDKDELKKYYYGWLYKNKSVLLGKVIGEKVPTECIPQVFIDSLNRAQEVSKL